MTTELNPQVEMDQTDSQAFGSSESDADPIIPGIEQYAKPFDSEEWGPGAIAAATANDDIAVTVVCITYNHEDFIAEALESFIMQKTSFKFKVLVGDDHSSDLTPDIIQEYARNYPDLIEAYCREENLGGMGKGNLIDLCKRATSPYIAFCEGDDYWVDPEKLQKQYDYMQAHPDCRVCTTRTLIEAPEDWHLRSWYRADKDGNMIIPDCLPGYTKRETASISYILQINVSQTSTYFFRWNYDFEIPQWYFDGMIGDISLLILQLGQTNLGLLEDVTSVYRINENSVFFDKDRDSSFLRTRRDYIRYLTDLREYALEHYRGYPITAIENRIKLESYNFLKTAVKVNDTDLVAEYFAEFPEAAKLSLNAFLSFYEDQRSLTRQLGWDGYRTVARNKSYRRFQARAIKVVKRWRKIKSKVNRPKKKIELAASHYYSYLCYRRFSKVPKDPHLWVFTSFRSRGYLDNSKYMYEYVVANHPEIQAWWITKSQNVFEELTERGMPVLRMGTKECTRIMSRATIAVTDHYRMSDYSCRYGFNQGTKIVQLWHGVGFKANGDGEKIPHTDVKGVRYSTDLLPAEGDSERDLIKKERLLKRYAYCRELFERYFMLICPGQERIDMLGKVWNIPESAYFLAGHPRNIDLYSQEPDEDVFKVLYAPTYRFNPYREKVLVYSFLDHLDEIQKCMEEIDGMFYFRLHPHTWRNYNARINYRLKEYDRIEVDKEPDVYQVLGTYALGISDYSSIIMDLAMLDRPVVFFCPDYDWYVKEEAGFNIDFDAAIPGPKTATWDDTLEQIRLYHQNPDYDLEERQLKTSYFFDPEANGPDNSERITQEIKRRLGI